MATTHIRILLLAAISAVGLSQSLPAGELYPLFYNDNGATISISGCEFGDIRSVTVPGLINGKPVTAIEPKAFFGNNGITNLILPSSVTTIGASAFESCRRLNTVTSPGGLTNIDRAAFASCDELTGITLPASVTTIDDFAFYNCSRLPNLTLPSGLTYLGRYALAATSIAEVTLPVGVTSISDYTFWGCYLLDKMVIPPHVVTIGEGVFTATRLREITLSPNLISIGNAAFAGTYLTEIAIPPTVSSFGNAVFHGCRNLTKITLPKNTTSIGEKMFAECYSLTELTIPAAVTSIGKNAFASSGMKSLKLPSGLTTIGESAFYNCSLTTVTIPSKVSDIGSYAFNSCNRLVSASFLGDAPVMQKQVFKLSAFGFKIFFSMASEGFTLPKWYGYPSSRPAPEIVVQLGGSTSLKDGEDEANFGNVIVGKKSTTRTYVIRNVGTKKLTGLSVITREGDFADFVPKNLTKSSLAPGKSASFQLVFKPKARGKRETTVEILSSDANENPFDFKLTGKGLVQF
ncbi:MAG: leucine-rich repeat protein [Armatimonadetes bacterium]|nr:leucine-rich repeat protein [Akkermansiaceae bacterium]